MFAVVHPEEDVASFVPSRLNGGREPGIILESVQTARLVELTERILVYFAERERRKDYILRRDDQYLI